MPCPLMVCAIFLVIFFFSALSPFEILWCFLLMLRIIAADPHITLTADRLNTLSTSGEWASLAVVLDAEAKIPESLPGSSGGR